jgi:integrase
MTRECHVRICVRIIGKGDKERRVPLPEPMLAKLRRLWLTHRNPRWLTPDRSGTGYFVCLRSSLSPIHDTVAAAPFP